MFCRELLRHGYLCKAGLSWTRLISNGPEVCGRGFVIFTHCRYVLTMLYESTSNHISSGGDHIHELPVVVAQSRMLIGPSGGYCITACHRESDIQAHQMCDIRGQSPLSLALQAKFCRLDQFTRYYFALRCS